MPIVGYVCPPGGEEPGRQNETTYCLTECKTPCVTPPLLAAMWKADTGNYHQGDYISASMLAGSGCSRQVMFERYHDFYDLPTKRYWPFRGTHAHAIVEGAQDIIAQYGWLQEIRMSTVLKYPLNAPVFDEHGVFTGDFDSTKDLEITVRGTCDAYNPRTRTLVDMKSMADKKVEMMIKGSTPGTYSKNLQDSWISQLNIYRFLIARTPIPAEVHDAYDQYGLPRLKGKTFPAPTKLFIQGIAMMSHPVSGGRVSHKERGKVTLYDLDNVPVWNLSDIEDFIRPRALEWYKALNLKQVPPVVPKDKSWLCRNCAFEGKQCFPDQERAAATSADGVDTTNVGG
jgi:hypothetical protein